MSNLLCDNEKKALQNMDNKVIIYDNDQNDTELTVQVGNWNILVTFKSFLKIKWFRGVGGHRWAYRAEVLAFHISKMNQAPLYSNRYILE